ncbi:MAG: hypothetical protein WCI76_01010 [bacterium]
MKKVFSIILVCVLSVIVGLSFGANVYAGNTPQTVATVNIYNAKIDSQNGNVFNLSFDISNRIGVQPNVKYSVILSTSTTTTQAVFDEHVYDEVLSLGENETIHKTITYTAPSVLSGKYDLMISSKNESGFPFALASLGKVTLVASASGVQIKNDTCYLTIQGEKGSPHYTLLQGVDVLPSETLVANCSVVNSSSSEITVTPKFTTTNRNAFGSVAPQEQSSLSSITLKAKESKIISLQIPKAINPQAYNTELVFTNSNGASVSNEVAFHYVLRGMSATIQQATFDKDEYMAGDTARVSLIVSGTADSFVGSRITTPTSLTSASVQYSIMGDSGACSVLATTVFALSKASLNVPITADCVNPKLSVNVKNNGAVIAEKDFSVATKNNNQGVIAVLENQPYIILLVVGLVVLALCIWLLRRRSTMLAVFLLVIGGGLFMFGGSAKADTIIFGNPDSPEAYATINFSKSSYATNENVIVLGDVQSITCSNLYLHIKVYLSDITSSATPPISYGTYRPVWDAYAGAYTNTEPNYPHKLLNSDPNHYVSSGQYTYVSPQTNTPGTYYVHTSNIFDELEPNGGNYRNISLPFAVTAPVGNMTISATSIVCNSETDLPNWGASSSEIITSGTADTFLSSHPNCHKTPWNFYWSPGTPQVGQWTPFTSNSGINNTTTIPIPSQGAAWVSEEIRSGYIPFAGGSNNVSAELYCYDDGLMYDNIDLVNHVAAGGTYYCIGFNAPNVPPVSLPTVSTNPVSSITSSTAISGGNITSNGGGAITASGVEWSILSNFSSLVSKTVDGATTGSWSSTMSPLASSNTYFVRAYATNSAGTAYGTPIQFSTLSSAITVTFTSTSTSITRGQSITLSWTSNVGSCTGTNFNTAGTASGSATLIPDATTTYSVNCGGQSASVTVSVKIKPKVIEPGQ